MTPTDEIVNTTITAPPGTALFWVQTIVAACMAVLVLSYPVMKLFRSWNIDKNNNKIENKQTQTEVFLYEHLMELIENNRKDLERYSEENARLIKTISELQSRVQKLEELETVNQKLKAKLDEKDEAISSRDSKIQVLVETIIEKDQRIAELEEKVRRLEKHLSEIEERFGKANQ